MVNTDIVSPRRYRSGNRWRKSFMSGHPARDQSSLAPNVGRDERMPQKEGRHHAPYLRPQIPTEPETRIINFDPKAKWPL
jgi:hypothetical protein